MRLKLFLHGLRSLIPFDSGLTYITYYLLLITYHLSLQPVGAAALPGLGLVTPARPNHAPISQQLYFIGNLRYDSHHRSSKR